MGNPQSSDDSDQGFEERARISYIWPERLQEDDGKAIREKKRERGREGERETDWGRGKLWI